MGLTYQKKSFQIYEYLIKTDDCYSLLFHKPGMIRESETVLKQSNILIPIKYVNCICDTCATYP